jgi:hypothetical protein
MSHPETKQPSRRPRTLAAGTLGLATAGAGLMLALSGTAAAKPAGAIQTQKHDSVLIRIDSGKSYINADRKLSARYHEEFTLYMARGAAKRKGPVTCKPEGKPRPTGPTVRLIVGKDGTEIVGRGAGNTGASGPYHIAKCDLYKVSKSGNTGNTGNTGSD